VSILFTEPSDSCIAGEKIKSNREIPFGSRFKLPRRLVDKFSVTAQNGYQDTGTNCLLAGVPAMFEELL
jgi:hypothetical protein